MSSRSSKRNLAARELRRARYRSRRVPVKRKPAPSVSEGLEEYYEEQEDTDEATEDR